MLFDDFSLWLKFLGELSEETNYEWYIKPHRDYSDLEFKELGNFIKKFPKIRLIDAETSYYQLKEEGVEFVLTCYGSAGHELPLLGFTVVNSSYNPHFAYEFNIHAKSILDYRHIILNLPALKLQDIDLKKVYEYYFIQKKFAEKDSLMGVSQEKLLRLSHEDPCREEVFEYLVENIELIHSEVERVMRECISLKLVYSYESSLPLSSQLKINSDLSNSDLYKQYASDYP
jgi:hypothetical protein